MSRLRTHGQRNVKIGLEFWILNSQLAQNGSSPICGPWDTNRFIISYHQQHHHHQQQQCCNNQISDDNDHQVPEEDGASIQCKPHGVWLPPRLPFHEVTLTHHHHRHHHHHHHNWHHIHRFHLLLGTPMPCPWQNIDAVTRFFCTSQPTP